MRWFAAAALAGLAAGCGSGRIYLDRDVTTAVVLAPLNDSQDSNAPWKMWKYVEYEVAARGYALVPHEVVEKFYQDKKFTGDPGQIKEYDTKELAKIFKADAVVWSNVAEWNRKTLVIYTSIEVKLEAELRDRDDNVLWTGKGEHGASTSALSGKKGLRDTAGALATDIENYAPQAAANCFGSLPWAGWNPEAKRAEALPPAK